MGSLRLFRSRAFCGYVLGGACTTTSFYAFMAASPFILVDLLHQPTERVGLYYLLLMAGVAAGGLSANRLAGRITAPQVALRIANSIAIAGAACFMLVDLAGWLNVVTVIAPIVVFMVGAGTGKSVRADQRGQRKPACDRRGIRVVRLHPNGVRRAVHGHRRGVAARRGVPGRCGAAGVRHPGSDGLVARGATAADIITMTGRRLPLLRRFDRLALSCGEVWLVLAVDEPSEAACPPCLRSIDPAFPSDMRPPCGERA